MTSSSADEDNVNVSNKRQRHNDYDGQRESALERKERFQTRWHQQHLSSMLLLNKVYGVATYGWQTSAMDLRHIADARSLVGSYDIVLVYGVPGGTDQGYESEPISRTIRGTLSIFVKEIQGYDYFYQEGEAVVYGRIQVDRSYRKDDSAGFWETALQMTDVEFRQYLDGNFLEDDPGFCITRNEGMDASDEYQVSIQTLTNSGTLQWIPSEDEETLSADDVAYKEYIQEQIIRRYKGRDDWEDETSWLCQHMGIPPNAAWTVHSFLMPRVPKPDFEWQAGDLLLELDMTVYSTSWTTHYLARRRQPTNM